MVKINQINSNLEKDLNNRSISSAEKPNPDLDFRSVLQQKQQILADSKELSFSAHAQKRIQSRNIALTPQDLIEIQAAIVKVSQKGSKESLLIHPKAAFIVNITNRTVITAIKSQDLKDNIFTGIDSVIVV